MNNQLEEIKSHRKWAKAHEVTAQRYEDDVDWLIEELERLLYENDNFAHENHSLTGDVSAERERIEVLTKERDELEKKIRAEFALSLDALKAENAELEDQMQELAKMGDEKAAEIQADLTACENKLRERDNA